jgi:AraC family transcriptional regulator
VSPLTPDLMSTNMSPLSFLLEEACCPSQPDPTEGSSSASQLARAGHHGIHQERSWRERTATYEADPSRILVGRWRCSRPCAHEHAASGDPHFTLIAVTLRPAQMKLIVDRQCLYDGRTAAGTALVVPAGRPAWAKFRGVCDFLHLYVPISRLNNIASQVGGSGSPRYFSESRRCTPDPLVEQLSWLIFKGGNLGAESSGLYIDGLAQAILTRVVDIVSTETRNNSRKQGLLKWRLQRVLEFIDAHLSGPLRSTELAKCAGLSRMHFAAQFRAATGLTPREYIAHKRIQRAQAILRDTETPLAEVALVVGFQTQAHFTTVFRRLLGETPGHWRQLHRLKYVDHLAEGASAEKDLALP